MIEIDGQKKEITVAVAARIRFFRHMKNMSQEDLALRANINPAYLGQVERGLKCPTVDTLYKISKGLEIPLPELLRFETTYSIDGNKSERIVALINRIPHERVGQVLKILESITELFE